MQASREKIRVEAQVKREHVPPQYRPKTYEPEQPKGKDKVFFKDLERERAKRTADQKGESLRSKFNAEHKQPAEAKPRPKTVKNEDVINRTKERAEKLRSNIPLQYRAKPYETVKQAAQSAKSAVKNAWESAKAGFTKSKPETAARTKMSDSFNAKSGFNQKSHAPDHGPDDSPEAEI